MKVIDQIKTKMKEALEHFKTELKNLRSGRANPGVLDNVQVEAYGSFVRLKEVATVTAPEARQLLITPFDPSTAGAIAKAIEKANLNLQPILDGRSVRINVPPMDESMRKEIVKQAKKKAEDAKVVIREIRRKGNETIRKQQKDGEITEDEVKKGEKQIQDLTDQNCKEIDTLFAAKEKEVMTV
jgi:ribosome recycling factor